MSGWMAALAAAGVVLFSQEAMQAASLAARVFAQSVMPALFPMMVLGRFLPRAGGLWATAAFGFAAGSPAAAQRVQQLWQSGQTDRPETLLALSGVMSPLFFTGSIARWTGDGRCAAVLLLLHWLSAAITAAVWSPFAKPVRAQAPSGPIKAACLPEVIAQSAQSLLGVCGAMMLFSVLAGVGRAVMMKLFPVPQRLMAVLWALMEIGGGASALAQGGEVPWALLGALCSFGGVSLWLQNVLFAPKCIRPAKLLWMRMLHGAVCYGLGLIIFP